LHAIRFCRLPPARVFPGRVKEIEGANLGKSFDLQAGFPSPAEGYMGDGFFEPHSSATWGEKDKKQIQKDIL